jgi:ketosteroid isomerase-like protein
MSDQGGDERAIRNLINSYTDAANRRDPVAAALTYAPDGVLSARSGPPLVGRPAIQAAFEQVFAARDLIFQLTQPGPLEIAGDQAHTRNWLREWTRLMGKPSPRLFLGLYQDHLTRTAEGWRFARRRLDGVYVADPEIGGRADPDPVMEHAFGVGG